jgi:hypothetical protein
LIWISIAGKSVLLSNASFTTREMGKPITSGSDKGAAMIVIGLVLMLIGFVAAIPVLWSIGIVVALVGLVLLLFGAAGREVGGRRHYY